MSPGRAGDRQLELGTVLQTVSSLSLFLLFFLKKKKKKTPANNPSPMTWKNGLNPVSGSGTFYGPFQPRM